MTIEDFLEILEDRDLVPESIVKQVRTKVEKGDRRITPKSLLKYLVKKEYVTKRQAKQLLETTLTVTPSAESSILGMVPIPKVPAEDKQLVSRKEEEVPTAQPVDDDAGGLVTDEGSAIRPDLFGDQPSSLVAESLSRIGAGADGTLTEAIEEGNHSDEGTKTRSKRKKNVKKNEWDSSLLLLGGGGLILLVITGVIIFYLLTRENADAVLAEASEYFDGQSYTQAIKQYERFVENHTTHPEFSAAKVKLGLARLWKASSGTSNFTEALATAESVLPEIEDEEEFSSAQRDLASLLPKIAQGLAAQAERSSDPAKVQELVTKTNAALSFCSNTKYIPKTFRDEVLLDEIGQTLERVERERAQKAALAQALKDMQAAVDAGNTAQAYKLHEQLLDENPGLINNEELAGKILEISTAEAGVVKYVEESKPATTEPRPSEVVAELALANRSGQADVAPAGIVAVRISGAVYGLNQADGSLRWRRFVGAAPTLAPVQLSNGDVLVVDDRHQELLRLEGQSGKLVWRHGFDSSVTTPVVFDQKLLVAESDGKLHVLDSASGERQGYVQFAQRLSAPPTVGSQGRRIYLTGEHSSLYTVSAEDFSCLGVFFLGHGKGTVTTPPVTVLNKVLVAVAKGLSTSNLEVLNTNSDGIPIQRAASRRLSGLVSTPLLTQGRRVVAATSRGQVAAFEVSSGDGEGSLTQIAQRKPEGGDLVARYGYLGKGHVWVVGPKLSKLAILPTSDRLSVSNIDQDYAGDIFDHPLQTRGNLLIHVRRPEGRAGAIVGAMNMDAGEPTWETELAASPAGPPAADPNGMQIGVVTSTGRAYLVDRETMRSRVLNRAEELSTRRRIPAFGHCTDLGEGRLLAFAEGEDTLLHFRPGLPRGALKTIKLVGPLGGAPVSWQDGFVAPTQAGQVFFYSSEDGQQWGSPFQPPLQPGVTYQWNSPAVYGSGEEAKLVISDGKEKIFLLDRVENPEPHLAAVEAVDISTAALNSRLAVVGDLAMAGAEDGSLSVFELPTLASRPSVDIAGQVTWGPFAVGQHVLLATAAEQLVCLDNQAKVVWQQSIERGPPAGRPVESGEGIVVLWQQGGISRLSISDGGESGYVELPQPVVAGPVVFGRRLVVSAYDGTLLIVNQP